MTENQYRENNESERASERKNYLLLYPIESWIQETATLTGTLSLKKQDIPYLSTYYSTNNNTVCAHNAKWKMLL
jgi:hypothetical protein